MEQALINTIEWAIGILVAIVVLWLAIRDKDIKSKEPESKVTWQKRINKTKKH